MAEYPETQRGENLDQPKNPEAYQRKWMGEIERAQRYFKNWVTKGEKVIRLYRKQNEQTTYKRQFAMLWANTQIMMPTVYAKVPEPVIERRFKDDDPIGRMASEILERACIYTFDKSNFDGMMKAVRDDLLLPGRGTCWIRFVDDGVIELDYLHWRDFVHQPGRRWPEVAWLAKRSYLSKRQMRERFPKLARKDPETGRLGISGLSPDNIPKSGITDEEKKALEGKYTVWELWDKETGQVCFLSPSAKEPLEITQPFVTLDEFWPCPEPLWATTTTDSLIPVPDYKFYQDQAEEIDDLTRRIAALQDGLKLVGFYPKGSEATTEIEKALQPGVENRMIGVEAWAAFSERGGIKSIVFLPIEEVVNTIKSCIELRTQLIQDVYQITGISDIMRGATNPNETLGAQQIKAQTGSIRVRDRQQDIQRFARDVLRITSEIIAEKFSPAVVLQMTNMMTEENAAPQKQMEIASAFQLMRDQQIRSFRIDVETDSTVQPDENADKQRRVEFATAMGQLFQGAVPLGQAMPQMVPLIGETIRFVARGFHTGRRLEDVLDQTLKQLEAEIAQKQQAAQNQPPTPTKEQIAQQRLLQVEKPKADADIQLTRAQALKTENEARAIPAEHSLKQDELFFGIARDAAAHKEKVAARQDASAEADLDRQDARQQAAVDQGNVEQERDDNLNARTEDQAQAEMERQDNLAQADADRALAAQQQNGSAQGNGSRPPEAPPGQPFMQGGIVQLLNLLAQSTAQNAQAIQQLAQVMALPTVVETPRGTYTARKMLQ